MAAGTLLAACGILVAGTYLQAQPKVDAATLYKTHCQLCHGANGVSPMKNASFADAEWVHGSSLAEVQNTIRNGVKGTVMMGFANKLSAEDLEALAHYVRRLDKTLK